MKEITDERINLTFAQGYWCFVYDNLTEIIKFMDDVNLESMRSSGLGPKIANIEAIRDGIDKSLSTINNLLSSHKHQEQPIEKGTL